MTDTHGITVDDSALARVAALRAARAGGFGVESLLRIAVEGGGCAGFQYKMAAVDAAEDGDLVFGGCVAIDPVSARYMQNATIRYQTDLMGAMFVIDNPGAVSSCGCKTSFALGEDAEGA